MREFISIPSFLVGYIQDVDGIVHSQSKRNIIRTQCNNLEKNQKGIRLVIPARQRRRIYVRQTSYPAFAG